MLKLIISIQRIDIMHSADHPQHLHPNQKMHHEGNTMTSDTETKRKQTGLAESNQNFDQWDRRTSCSPMLALMKHTRRWPNPHQSFLGTKTILRHQPASQPTPTLGSRRTASSTSLKGLYHQNRLYNTPQILINNRGSAEKDSDRRSLR